MTLESAPLVPTALRLADSELLRLLAEDVPHGDLTTEQLGISARRATIQFAARGPMRLAASEEAARLLELCGATCLEVSSSGSSLAAGAIFLKAEGTAAAVFTAWKVAQTLVEYASGIASAAAAIVSALELAGLRTPVACTRKQFPGTKAIAVRAVRAGGAIMHRLGLSETLLVFPEHLRLLPANLQFEALAALRLRCPERRLVVEATSEADAIALATAGAEVIQLEKFRPEALAACRSALSQRGLSPLLAAAGGVGAGNAVAYARAGADLLVTSAPFFAPPADVQVHIAAL